jgi:micrococcal nuclease
LHNVAHKGRADSTLGHDGQVPRVLLVACIGVLVTGCGLAGGSGPGGRAAETTTPVLSGQPPVPAAAFTATVERAVDGDTFIAVRAGRRLRVRLIGVDAPESVKEGAPVGCFGPEASSHLHGLLRPGVVVRAAYEPGGRTDQFGRELWDVWLPDGRFVQADLVSGGFARAHAYRPQHEQADYLARVQRAAKAARVGLWSACPT